VDVEVSPVEAAIRARLDSGDLAGAMTAAVEGYGEELFSFLVGLSGDRDRAGDDFGATCEKMWRALDRFRWESTFRAWMYTIARNTFLTSAARARRMVPLSGVAAIDAAVERVRTLTPAHQRTEVKDRFARLRAAMPPDDHMLLGLRLDRRLTWNEIAQILGDGDPDHLKSTAVTLRKRYQRLKRKLEELADEVLGE
jgi:RNA polymerase sigma-70 factor (ECF subfamily)